MTTISHCISIHSTIYYALTQLLEFSAKASRPNLLFISYNEMGHYNDDPVGWVLRKEINYLVEYNESSRAAFFLEKNSQTLACRTWNCNFGFCLGDLAMNTINITIGTCQSTWINFSPVKNDSRRIANSDSWRQPLLLSIFFRVW